MRCVPRVAAFPWLAAALAAVAASGAQESALTRHALATGLVPGDARFDVLLPPDYAPARTEPYPLLLWLHGGSGGEGQLERRLRAPLERAWERGTIEPIVVVAPITGNSYWIDWKGGGHDWETGNPVDVAYWRARHPPTIVIDNAERLRRSGLQLLVEAGDEDANLTFLGAELVHRLLFDAAIEHEYHLVRGAAHTGRSVPRRLENVFGFFQRALRPEGPDPEAERHLAAAKRWGRYAPRVPNQLRFDTVDFEGGDAAGAPR